MLGVFAQLEAEMTQQRVKEGIATRQQDKDYHHGPAPLGFQKDDLSKRKAAHRLGCSRSTIGRALERGELYGL
jgi:DNA invertase Pin-like site-specific DNA recombinase